MPEDNRVSVDTKGDSIQIHSRRVRQPNDADVELTANKRAKAAGAREVSHKNDRGKKGSTHNQNSTMNILRSFAELDALQRPRLTSLARYDGISLGPDLQFLSPGSVYGGNRVGCVVGPKDAVYVYMGSGRHVYGLNCALERGAGGAGMERGKGGHVYLPASDGVVRAYEQLPAMSCRAEIQSLSTSSSGNGSQRVLVTDVYGRGVCGTLSVAETEASDPQAREPVVQNVYPLSPDDAPVVAAGGLTVGSMSNSSSYTVIARHFPKDVTVFDGDAVVRTLHTLGNPNAVKVIDDALVTVAEGNMVTVYDVRIAERQARVARLQPVGSTASGRFYALAASGNGCDSLAGSKPGNAPCPLLGAGGEDRGVFVWDPRVWKSVNQWKNCLKYELTSLHFLDSDPRYCLASGMDYEVVCGAWFENKSKAFAASARVVGSCETPETLHALGTKGRATGPVTEAGSVAEAQRQSRVVASYRGMSRWIGMSKLDGHDVFVGVTSDGMVYKSEFCATSEPLGMF